MSRKFLFIFLDGVGLGSQDPALNPFTQNSMPFLQTFLEGKKLVAADTPVQGLHFSLSGIDASMGIPGMPQSATGQASLLTGFNIPLMTGGHFGPKPNDEIRAILKNGNLFQKLVSAGFRVCLLNAYPQRFFDSINSGRRLLSAIPFAVESAGLRLMNTEDYFTGLALSADFTGKGWRDHLKMPNAPLYTPMEAGIKMASLAAMYDFAFFEFWLSDYAGHAQDMDAASALLSEFDQVISGLFSRWELDKNLVLITSDHGNMEDLGTHRHTLNPVPALVIGDTSNHLSFSSTLHSLADVSPAILRFFDLQH